MNINYEGAGINFQNILESLLKYKWANLFILLSFLLFGIVYYIFSKPIYKSAAKIQIEANAKDIKRDFFGNNAGFTTPLETEIDILKSNRIIDKAIDKIDAQVQYFQANGSNDRELYNSSPYIIKHFIIYNPNIYSKKIEIIDLGNNRFRLQYKKDLSIINKLINSFNKNRKKLEAFDKTYHFGQIIVNGDVALQIVKNNNIKIQDNKIYFQFNSIDDLEEDIKRNLTVEKASKESSILDVSYKDNNPIRSRDFVNSLISSYIDYSQKSQSQDEERELKFVNEQLKKIRQRLESSENSLEDFKSNYNISDLNVQNEELVRKLGVIKEKLDIETIEYEKAKRVYNEIVKGNYSIISSYGEDYPAVNNLLENLNRLLVEKTNLLEEFTSKHPRVLAIEKNIKKIKNSIKKIAKGIKEQHLSAKRKYEAELKKEKEILKKYPQIEKYLVRHKRLFEVNDNIYNYLLKKQSELNVEKVSNLTNKRVIDYAKIPKKPLNKKLPFILIATLLLGVISALIHSIVRTHLDTKIKSSQDVEKISDIPIYGIVPYIEDKNRYNSLFVLSDQDSGATEAFRAIRANLSYISNPNSAKVILISSSVPNEGKTIVAANLATIIGMSEKRTILLSLDLRRPELHQKFSLPNDKGMSDILSGKIDYKKALWEHSRFKNLHIITSGPIPPNPAELIESNRMRKLLEELKKEYDYIIIDTPPINYVSDATSLFKYSDLNLFVLKSEFSDSRYLKELDSLLKKLNIKHNGIILNSVKSKYTVKKYFDERYVAHKEGL